MGLGSHWFLSLAVLGSYQHQDGLGVGLMESYSAAVSAAQKASFLAFFRHGDNRQL